MCICIVCLEQHIRSKRRSFILRAAKAFEKDPVTSVSLIGSDRTLVGHSRERKGGSKNVTVMILGNRLGLVFN